MSRWILISLLIQMPLIHSVQVKSKSYSSLLKILLSHSLPEVTVSELSPGDTVTLLDARELNEFKISKIEGATHVGYDDFDLNSVSDIDKDQKVVVYCSVSYRSQKIAEKLISNGFKDISNLYGGIFEWENKGKKVVNSEEEETEEVHAFSRIWGTWLKKDNHVYD